MGDTPSTSTDRNTIVAHASGRPPAAIAIIRVSGPQAHTAAERLAGRLPRARKATLRTLRAPGGDVLDRALLLRFDAPASATGEDVAELHCHGSRAVVAAVIAALVAQPGCRLAEPGEFTRRALINGRLDLTEAEGLADLLEAETELQRRSAMAVAEGGVRQLVEGWRDRIIDLSAQAEAAIDYVGDEEETALDEDALRTDLSRLAVEWTEWLRRPRSDLLRRGARVVLAGPPNVGKSSLFNALVGSEKAIVTEVPGTTRDVLEAPMALDGVPLVLIDTAGVRDTGDIVEVIGVARAHQEADRADLLLWLGEPHAAPEHSSLIKIHPQKDRRPLVPAGSIGVSAITGEGLGNLLVEIHQKVERLLPSADELALNERQAQLVSEALTDVAVPSRDLAVLADQLRGAREKLDRITGRNGTEDVLDALFGRFCLGK